MRGQRSIDLFHRVPFQPVKFDIIAECPGSFSRLSVDRNRRIDPAGLFLLAYTINTSKNDLSFLHFLVFRELPY